MPPPPAQNAIAPRDTCVHRSGARFATRADPCSARGASYAQRRVEGGRRASEAATRLPMPPRSLTSSVGVVLLPARTPHSEVGCSPEWPAAASRELAEVRGPACRSGRALCPRPPPAVANFCNPAKLPATANKPTSVPPCANERVDGPRAGFHGCTLVAPTHRVPRLCRRPLPCPPPHRHAPHPFRARRAHAWSQSPHQKAVSPLCESRQPHERLKGQRAAAAAPSGPISRAWLAGPDVGHG